MCSCGVRGSMYMIWCSHLKVLWHTDIGGSLVVQGSFLFYTEKCIMMACPKSAKKGPLRHAAACGGESPLS